MPRILISGISGLLGSNLAMSMKEAHDIQGTYLSHPIQIEGVTVRQIDLLQSRAIETIMQQWRPDWIIHTVASTDVDACEQDPEMAAKMNRDLPGSLARAASAISASFVHISTDAVFDGERGGYRETDQPDPINVYGRTKLAGEHRVAQENPAALILRTNFFGWNATENKSLAEWLIDTLRQNNPLKGFTDVTVSFLLVNYLAAIIEDLLAREASGIYHVASRECVSKFDFAHLIADTFGLDKHLIEPALANDVGLSALRPRKLCLDPSKLESFLGRSMPEIAGGVRELKFLESNGYKDRLKISTRRAPREVEMK